MLRILVMDSSHEFRHAALETLQQAGFEVVCAIDGDHAQRKLGQQSFAAVIMETAVTDGGALQVLRRIRRLSSSLPVIVVTSCPCPETDAAYAELGVHTYLLKPVSPEVLLAAVQAAAGNTGSPWSARIGTGLR